MFLPQFMKLHERLKIPPTAVDVSGCKRMLEMAENPTAYELETNLDGWKSNLPFERYLLGIHAYLADELDCAEEQFQKLPTDVVEYFFGEWRKAFLPVKTKGDFRYWKKRAWMEIYVSGILTCAIIGQWKQAVLISSYPDQECGLDVDGKPADRSFLLAMAEWLTHGKSTVKLTTYISEAVQSKTPRAREEIKLLEAALNGSAEKAIESFSAYMRFYQKKIFPLNDMTEKQSKMGTFFWHWWMKEGVNVDPENTFSDFVIRISNQVQK